MSAREIATIVLLGLGVLLELVACLGIVAMRGVYDRLHFTGLTTLGAAAIAAAVLVDDSFSMIGDKALLVAVFVLVTAPVLTHATARAARVSEHGDWRLRRDERVDVEER